MTNTHDKARELREQADALLAKAKELENSLANPVAGEVWAYIGTKLDQGGYVVDWDGRELSARNPLQVSWQSVKGTESRAWPDTPTINGKRVTHFQPIKAEVRHADPGSDRPWVALANGESLGYWMNKTAAEVTLHKFAKKIAPWWKGELKIEERR